MKRKQPSAKWKPRKKRSLPVIPCELWKIILYHLRDIADVSALARVGKDHFLHSLAMERIRKWKMERAHHALHEMYVAAPGRVPVGNPETARCPESLRTALHHVDMGADDVPAQFLRLLHQHNKFFYDGTFGGRFATTNIVPEGFRIPEGERYRWFLSVSFRELDNPGRQNFTVDIFQEQPVHRCHRVGETLRTFFRRFGFWTRLIRRRGNGHWDDNHDDDDYVQPACSESDSDEEEFPKDRICCPECANPLDYCLCDRCSMCSYEHDSCICT